MTGRVRAAMMATSLMLSGCIPKSHWMLNASQIVMKPASLEEDKHTYCFQDWHADANGRPILKDPRATLTNCATFLDDVNLMGALVVTAGKNPGADLPAVASLGEEIAAGTIATESSDWPALEVNGVVREKTGLDAALRQLDDQTIAAAAKDGTAEAKAVAVAEHLYTFIARFPDGVLLDFERRTVDLKLDVERAKTQLVLSKPH